MRFSIRKALRLLSAVSLVTVSLLPTSSPALAAAPILSPYGTQAIGDLASCLRTSQSLDVYYLVDSSGSLSDSDPTNQRAVILKQDVKRWADILKIQPKLQIRVAGSTFSTGSNPLLGWQGLTSSNSDEVAQKLTGSINNSNIGGFTNWRAGLEAAYSQLHQSSAGCKTVIWFTDGGLWPLNGGDRLHASLKDIAFLCGSSDSTGVPRDNSDQGFMAQMRRDQIHVFGILLNAGKDTEPDESFYRSFMKPILEENGNLPSFAGLPSGKVSCGDNSPAETRTYAAGAFLEAHSAADVAFNFMTIPAIVSGATMTSCPGNGDFWLDPGIGSFEYNTDASSWKISDAAGKVVKQSDAKNLSFSTGKIQLPRITTAQKWHIQVSGGTGRCALYVYPELYLDLHQKSLIVGKSSSITGQFVGSLSSHDNVNLSTYRNVNFSATVDGQKVQSQLDNSSGQFQINQYTPAHSGMADVGASLQLQTEHYSLDPINFKQSEQVFDASAIPTIGKIEFDRDMRGAKGYTTATATVQPTAQATEASVCFDKPKIISDAQDESGGAAQSRTSGWKIATTGEDSSGCVNLSSGDHNPKKVSFKVSNAAQANSKVSALFNYDVRLGNSESATFKDSQTASFNSAVETNNSQFWLILTILLLAGFALPFTALILMRAPLARVRVPRPINVAVLDAKYNLETHRVELLKSYSNQELAFEFREMQPPASNQPKRFQSSLVPSGVDKDFATGAFTIEPRVSKWPLKMPTFNFYSLDNLAFPVGPNSGVRSSNVGTTIQYQIAKGTLDRLAYLLVNPNDAGRDSLGFIRATLVVYNSAITTPENSREVVTEITSMDLGNVEAQSRIRAISESQAPVGNNPLAEKDVDDIWGSASTSQASVDDSSSSSQSSGLDWESI